MSAAICFVVDPGYAQYAIVQAIEAAKFANGSSVHVFVEGEERTAINAPDHINMHFNELLHHVPRGLPESSKWSRIVYGRIFLPKVLDAVRILYFDADVAIVSDIKSLLNMPFNDMALLAVHDTGLVGQIAPGLKIPTREWLQLIGLQKPRYFNSGVLCINAPVWRQIDFATQLTYYFEEFGQHARMWDQDFLNYTFQDRWGELSPAYNYQLSLFGLGFEDVFDPAVIHFTDSKKPWHADFAWSNVIASYFKDKLGKAGFEQPDAQSLVRFALKKELRRLAHQMGLPGRRAKSQLKRWHTRRSDYVDFYQSALAENTFLDGIRNPSALKSPPDKVNFDGHRCSAPFSDRFLQKFKLT